MSEDEPRVTVGGFRIDLDSSRHVWVGQEGGKFFLLFKRDDLETRVVLSREAAKALQQLLGIHFEEDARVELLVHVSEIVRDEMGKMAWRRAKE